MAAHQRGERLPLLFLQLLPLAQQRELIRAARFRLAGAMQQRGEFAVKELIPQA